MRPIKIIFRIILVLSLLHGPLNARVLASIDSGSKKMMLSRVDLRKYFEKAMDLFESGRYKESIAVFENLIEIEKSQNESYFTPFAEIYIEKSRSRMKEMIIVKDRRWKKMQEGVINEAEKIAEESAKTMARDEDSILEQELARRQSIRTSGRADAGDIYRRAVSYYKNMKYPAAIVEFKRILELYPGSDYVSRAEYLIDKAQERIKQKEEEELLVRMEAAREASIEMELENKRREMEEKIKLAERERMEARKARLKEIFEERLRKKIVRDRVVKMEGYLDKIKFYLGEEDLDKAKEILSKAMAEFPKNDRLKDIEKHIKMQEIKIEEKALQRAREITEEKMLLEVAKKHLIPEQKFGTLKKDKEITPLVRIPEIRKRLKIPISVDFKDVELDYVLSFLSDATGVNIIPSSEIDMEDKKVTMKIKDMPLEEALRYILKSQELLYRIEEDAVWVASKDEMEKENIDTRVYFLNQGIGRFAEFTGTYSQEEGSTASTEVKTVNDILENAVEWPKDSKLTMDNRTGALIVSNTPSNLEIIENLLYTLDVTPKQVLIEARFLEVKVTDVNELGFEWALNSDWGVKQNNSKGDLHGFASGSGSDFSDFSRGSEGFNLTYQGILSHPQFQAVLHALNEKQNVKTLSAPRITTLNNQTATIEVIDEYIYPTRYEVSLVQYDINGDGDFDDAGETEWANIPQDFVTRDVGILLHVKPSVGVDNKTVTLSLTPEVSEQDSTTPSYTYSGNVSIPSFKTRNLSTSVIIETGETVVMGGLIKEASTNTETKVPFLGDLPVVGGLFRKNTDNVERRNLLIFVTASVLNANEVMADASVEREKSAKQ